MLFYMMPLLIQIPFQNNKLWEIGYSLYFTTIYKCMVANEGLRGEGPESLFEPGPPGPKAYCPLRRT